MKYEDKNKKSIEQPNEHRTKTEYVCCPSANTMVSVLFERQNISIKEFEKVIAENFGQKALVSIDNSHPTATHFMLLIDDLEFVCSYMPFPFPKEEADISTLLELNHFISPEENKSISKHQSFCLIAQIGGGITLEGKRAVCILINRLCGALLEIDAAIGVLNNITGLLIGKQEYQKHTAIIRQESGNSEYFPAILWILVYTSHMANGKTTIETCGLDQFGFMELQFYNPKEDWTQSYEKLYLMSLYQITGKELYKNMDTISFVKGELSILKQSENKLAVIGGI